MEPISLSNSNKTFTVSGTKGTFHNTAYVNNRTVFSITIGSLFNLPKTDIPKKSLFNEKIKQLKESDRKHEIINHMESKFPNNLIKNERNASILKYRSKGEEIKLNCKVNNSKSNKLIMCCHLAAAFVHEAIGKKTSLNKTTKNSKFAMINTAEKLRCYQEIMTDKELNNIAGPMKISNEAYYFDDKGLGKVLESAWDKLEQRQCESVSYTFCSLNHAMGLRMKREPDRPEVRLELYDPNDTAAVMHFIVPSKEAMKSLKISDFFNESNFKEYFSEKSPVGVLYSSDIESKPGTACVQLSGALTPEMIHLLATMGHLSNKDIKESAKTVLKSMGNDQQKELLECKDEDGTLGLHMALQNGHEDSVNAFAELIKLSRLKPKDIKELLECKRKDGTPGLWMALQNEHKNSIKAFVELIKLGSLESKNIKELLECKDENGTPGLFMALQNGRTLIIKAFSELLMLSGLESKDIKELLGCKRKNGTPGLFMAFQYGHQDSVRAFFELLMEQLALGKLDSKDIKELLECKDEVGVPGLLIAVKVNKLNAISSFITSVLNPNLDLVRNDKLELLQASFSGKTVMQRHTGLPKEGVLYYKSAINDSDMLSDDEKKKILGDDK